MGEFQDRASIDHQLRSRKAKRVVIFTDNNATNDPRGGSGFNKLFATIRFSARRNETKDMVELGQLLYEVYPMLDAEAHNRSI
ncbi:hypothetical protein H5410_028401 [Solanum commersonii]|uniref:Protein TIC 214 n=1 Tax=Solanum commersonii TaxID=4109 RepID=A0A9J5Z3X4_SOLCO|nr:hypothetical protein H5410_028401 [Solanum commersonii]